MASNVDMQSGAILFFSYTKRLSMYLWRESWIGDSTDLRHDKNQERFLQQGSEQKI